MLPDEEVVNGDISNLGLSAVGAQQTEPVFRCDDVVGVRGSLGLVQYV